MKSIPAQKIEMLQGSLRCLGCGVLGLLPIIGVPFAFAALWISGRVREREKVLWNAAKPHRVIGVACAAFGTILWFLVVALIAMHHASSSYDG